ncbi:putative alpha/beta superfamily hydrolase [Mucilaginibacter gracilis]|uniref:Putative alpha/beta superfamily hydrolase n=1 Tax=Mucilaginibacter gracilis TaxID=423350 RepID=A0A495J7R7_9SPHI|nr:alpha/beta hydrolase-fold protein [Mucilaginibacter gracilis]RKR84458.1 putative alpha/beta superfamily hydrolase [Mucilaginibacter gracilis]
MNTLFIKQNFQHRWLIMFLLFVLINNVVIAQALPKVACGSVKRVENFSSRYVMPRNVDVWLPEGYTKSKKYAVLYMHDGQMLFDSTTTWNHQEWGADEAMCKLIASNQIKNCIVVAIWNTTQRHPEYFPQKPFYSMTNADQQRMLDIGKEKGTPLMGKGPVSDNYLKFLVLELKPYIDSHFSTRTDRQNTFIAGSSMGGLISMYAICEYPDVFGGAACLSTHWTGIFTNQNNPIPSAFLHYLDAHLPSPKNHKIYFDYGSKTLDSLYKPYQLQADGIMKAKGYTPKNWISLEFPGEDHSEKSWRKRLDIPLLFLLKK